MSEGLCYQVSMRRKEGVGGRKVLIVGRASAKTLWIFADKKRYG